MRFIVLFSLLLISSPAWASHDEVFIQTVAMESSNQPFEGQVAVASVILNRARMRGQTVPQVCKAPRQFSCFNDPEWTRNWLERYYTPEVRSKALSAILEAQKSHRNLDITHYHALSVRPRWAKGHKPCLVISDHAFYKGIK